MSDILLPTDKYISVIYRFSRRYFARELKNFPTAAGQLPFLIAVLHNPGFTQEKISDFLGMDKGTTARNLAFLESRGLITRVADENDRRSNNVFPTKEALALKNELFSVIERLNNTIFSGFGQSERDIAVNLLAKMQSNIQNELE